jgi:hypothetical protein
MQVAINYHLFGGEHAYCLPGMDGYVGQYEDVEHAMKVAESNKYDWAHIVTVAPLELQIIQVGRWNDGLKRMVWQADLSPESQRERYIKTFCSVMRSGVMLVGKISSQRRWSPPKRIQLMINVLTLYDDIQMNMGTMPVDMQNSAIHLARQYIGQIIEAMHWVQLSKKEKQEWTRWQVNANGILEATKDMVLFGDRWESI